MAIHANPAFPRTELVRNVTADLTPGQVLAREGGDLVLWTGDQKTGPTAILLTKPEAGLARCGFAGVYVTHDLQLEGTPPDTLGRLEARGIHVMDKEGKEPARAKAEAAQPKTKPKAQKEA